jgi:hypothetical protein
MRFPRLTVRAVTIGAVISLVISGVAFAATFSGGSSGTLTMNAGDSAHVTCAGPALSVAHQTGTGLDLNCAPNPTTTTTMVPPGPGLTLAPSPPLALADGKNVPGQPPATATTVSFTPPANSLLLALGANNNYAYDYGTSWQSVSGGGLSWGRVTHENDATGGTQGGAEVWAATVGASPTAMRVTAVGNATQLSTADWVALQVLIFTSATGTPTVGASAVSFSPSGLPSASLNVQAGSLVAAVASDWSANAGAPAFGPGQTSIANGLSPSLNSNPPDFAWHFWRTSNSAASAGSQTLNMTAPVQNFDEAVVEVQPNP